VHPSQEFLDPEKKISNEYIRISSTHGVSTNTIARKKQKTMHASKIVESDAHNWASEMKSVRNLVHTKAKIVREYFANQLNQNSIPWIKLTRTDFVNWPDGLQIKSPFCYSKDELIFLLSQLEKIRFSDQFLEKQHIIQDESPSVQAAFNKFFKTAADERKMISDHFKRQLELNNIRLDRIGWTKLKKEDFLNWPENIPIKSPHKFNSTEMKIILANLKQIRFSDIYL
jgi:Zn-dependent metalloprotease